MTDSSMNNLVHLAERLAPSYVLSRTAGAALQLQCELQRVKWRNSLPTDLLKENIYMEAPEMVFTREHANLVKEGEQWMKTTTNCDDCICSSYNCTRWKQSGTGIPLFRKEIAFTIFAVADAISLFLAATSLLVFLSILTTRFSEKDFLEFTKAVNSWSLRTIHLCNCNDGRPFVQPCILSFVIKDHGCWHQYVD
nr:ankyrin repeat-containing protein [Tanacetum cinerariifolium]